jgi:LPXTG-motif cell wall-anchored protein
VSREGRTGRRALAIAAVIALAVLAVFAAPGFARKGHGRSKPHAALQLSDRTATVGQTVVFDSSRSRGDIAYHLWDLDGDNEYETSTHQRARVSHAFSRPGAVRVAVAVFDDHGGYDVQRATLHVVDRPSPAHSEPAAKGSHGGHVHAATEDKGSKGGHKPKAKSEPKSSSEPADLHAAAASTSSVTIRDFEFDPKAITVSVGTTVTWTNQGPTAHTATADDGTFDTGNLVKGASGSYKFTKAGKYDYHCTPHPYMKATVTVTSSGGSSSPDDSSSSNSSSNGNSGSSSHHSSSLPHTGLQIASFVLAGLALLSGGMSLRRRLRRS